MGNIIPYTETQSIPQCITKNSVQPMVTYQAIFTIMHCVAEEHMEVSIQLSDGSDITDGGGKCVFLSADELLYTALCWTPV